MLLGGCHPLIRGRPGHERDVAPDTPSPFMEAVPVVVPDGEPNGPSAAESHDPVIGPSVDCRSPATRRRGPSGGEANVPMTRQSSSSAPLSWLCVATALTSVSKDGRAEGDVIWLQHRPSRSMAWPNLASTPSRSRRVKPMIGSARIPVEDQTPFLFRRLVM